MRSLVLTAALSAALVACSSDEVAAPQAPSPSPTPSISPTPPPPPTTGTVRVSIKLGVTGGAVTDAEGGCIGKGYFASYSPGHSADLVGPNGAIIATTTLRPGTRVAAEPARNRPASCQFRLVFRDVPLTADLVKLHVQDQAEFPTERTDALFSELGLGYLTNFPG